MSDVIKVLAVDDVEANLMITSLIGTPGEVAVCLTGRLTVRHIYAGILV